MPFIYKTDAECIDLKHFDDMHYLYFDLNHYLWTSKYY